MSARLPTEPQAPPPPPPRQDLPALLARLARLLQAEPVLHGSTHALLELVSERVQQLQAQARDLRALFDALPDPVCILDRDGTVVDLNQAGLQAYQRQRGEVVGQHIHILNPDLPDDQLHPVWDMLERGLGYLQEVTNMRRDGSRFPVEVHSGAVRLDGRPHIVAIARDLSNRWEAEHRHRLLMECIDKGVLLFDRRLRVVSANPAAHRILGLDSLSAHPVGDSVVQRQWLAVDARGRRLRRSAWPLMRAFHHGQTVASTIIGLFHPLDRHLIWLSVTVVPVFGCNRDRPDHVFAMFSDISAIKRDAALFERAQTLAHIGGWEWDPARQQLFLTSEARKILGGLPQTSSLEDVLACLHEGSRQALLDAAAPLSRQPGCFDVEIQGVRSDGQRFWARMIGESEPTGYPSLRFAGTIQDITERRRAEELLRIAAHTDALTGVMNRDALLGELASRLEAGQHTAVLYIDLDHFKLVNDVLGHNAGDRLLVQACERMLGAIGADGQLGRMGGDEFVVVCDAGNDPGLPEHLARAIVDAFVAAFLFGQDRFTVSPSIGIAAAPDDGSTPDQLLQNADVAMYECKRRSRNGWRRFSPVLARRQQHRLQIEGRLRQALDQGEFHLVYQPRVDLRSGHITGVEALIRWHNQDLGQMRPDLFISHAENTGDIVRIGTWVLEQACLQARRWRDAGLALLPVAVNVSYRQFAGEALVEVVQRLLAEHGLPGGVLELEFTERVLIEDSPLTIKTFHTLKAMGVRLYIDDFGEGYSALNYLRRLPIDGLKLSQLFIGGIDANPSDLAVCQAVQGIAQSLGLQLVAEGIETDSQRRSLLAIGIDAGQGFLFDPGLEADALGRRLLAGPYPGSPDTCAGVA